MKVALFIMNLIAIIVYNRFNNLKHWIECWEKCKHLNDAELVVIHNTDNPENEDQLHPWRELCKDIIYIPRQNMGFDIGALQDVARNKLPGFPEYDNLLWCCDDLLPMQKDFAIPFWQQLSNRHCVAMEISPYHRRHIRTTGFALSRRALELLQFPADPIITKQQCFQFEHKGPRTILDQLPNSVMVAPQAKSPLFDTGYARRIKSREHEHYHAFEISKELPEVKEDKGSIIIMCPIYKSFPLIAYAMLCQTYQSWKLYLVHDGPGEINLPDDPRITFIQNETRVGNYGHSLRSEWLQKLAPLCDYIIISNPDNYYAPVFLERALAAMTPTSLAVFCDQMVHNYVGYGVLNCRLERGYIDCGQVMIRAKQAAEVGWNSMHPSSDWFYFQDIANKFGADKFISFAGCLFIHN